ncbi:MAG TPA: FeoA family protein [Bacteroidota bacterium]|nr:FeoA family protein [Bacteroidota bacterium]
MTNLKDVPEGTTVRVRQLRAQPELGSRLRELGFCEDALVRCVINGSHQMICEVGNTRIGMHHSIARSILVTPKE